MAGTRAGGARRAAARHGIHVDAYIGRRAIGLLPCTRCRAGTRRRTPRGSACHSFIDGRAAERVRGRVTDTRLKRWRFDVMARDGFRCRWCGDARGGNLVAHHVLPWAAWPLHRYLLCNGLTLCIPCHRIHHYGKVPAHG